MSPLSYEDKRTFVSLHEVVKYKALECLNPEADMEEMVRNAYHEPARSSEATGQVPFSLRCEG